MSSSTFAGNSEATTGFCPVPPPPPPPPVPGQVPALRISTSENFGSKIRPQSTNANDPYEPPAAIQNAMLTKDKKPFTYTPGMGGKLDLSQIRSPRMARRVAKNANDEGIEGPPKSALESKTAPAQTGSSLFIQPQVAVPVFPTNVSPQPVHNKPAINNVNRVSVPMLEKQIEPPKNVIRVDTKMTPNTTPPSSYPETPTTPPQVTLTKAPTPWMLKKNNSQEELPEWAKRPNKSQESTPESPISPPVYVQLQQPPPPPPRQPSPQPYINQRPKQQQQIRQPTSAQEHVIPLRIEDRPSVFSIKHEPGHHQFKQPSTQHQQRWGQQVPQQNQVPIQVQVQPKPQNQAQQSGGSYIIPVIVEGKEPKPSSGMIPSSSQSQTRIIPVENQTSKVNVQRNAVPTQQAEPGPVQSRSFRVLQKITSTDIPDEVDGEQLRKLQLTEDDKALMNKFKEKVDSDTYLHQEEDPRYRGAAIPSRAFRYLQNMTDAGEITTNTVPRTANAINKKQNRNSKTFEEVPVNVPPSEQQVQEPKKYTGSAIPSRSFRILQAMTAPESIAIQENRQADIVCQTENSMSGNQQGIFFPPCPLPYWNLDGDLWGYYPIAPYSFIPESSNNHLYNAPYAFYNCADSNNAYTFYPIYNQNYNAYHIQPVTIRQNQPNLSARDCNNYPHSQEAVNFSTPPYKPLNNTLSQGEIFHGNPLRRNSALLSCPGTCRNESNKIEYEKFSKVYLTKNKTLKQNVLLNEHARVTVVPYSDDSELDTESFKTIDSSSESDSDSDSYLAYSTGLNPCDDRTSMSSETTFSEDTYEQSFVEFSSDKQNCVDSIESDDDNANEFEELQNSNSKETNEPSDDNDTMTVSVSLPLRFKFSVSQDNEDVTTVIVGDSMVKPEKISDVSVDFQLNSSDFTIKQQKASDTESQVDFTLKTEPLKEANLEEHLNVAVTIKTTSHINTDANEKEEKLESESQNDITDNVKTKSLLSIRNSREETDDEDSGVTSDMSRIISEVDTDSECCGSNRKLSKYQRTQTHSRLFRLLNGKESTDDSVLSSRRNRLSLPLDMHSFNYDDNCLSNYSSGMTSPECSPVSENSWRRIYDPEYFSNETRLRKSDNEDSYYQTWKTSKSRENENVAVPSFAYKILENKRPHWAYKVNVLCPRIKSSKNIPQTLKSSHGKPLGPPILSLAQNPLKNNRC